MLGKKDIKEYISLKTMIVVLMYNFLFLTIAIFSIFTKMGENNLLYKILYGSVIALILVVIFSFSTFYKKDESVKYDSKYDYVNRVITYIYLVLFLVYLIFIFLERNSNLKLNNFYMSLTYYLLGGVMALLSVITIFINLYVAIKNRVKIPLKVMEEQIQKDNSYIN